MSKEVNTEGRKYGSKTIKQTIYIAPESTNESGCSTALTLKVPIKQQCRPSN